MDHNLIPPFILREAGLTVNERPKIHTEPEKRNKFDHSIIDKPNFVGEKALVLDAGSANMKSEGTSGEKNTSDLTQHSIPPHA